VRLVKLAVAVVLAGLAAPGHRALRAYYFLAGVGFTLVQQVTAAPGAPSCGLGGGVATSDRLSDMPR
jgi:hypothetical protein